MVRHTAKYENVKQNRVTRVERNKKVGSIMKTLKNSKLYCRSIGKGYALVFLSLFQAMVYGQLAPVLDGAIDSVYLSNALGRDFVGYDKGADATLYVLDDVSIDPDYVWVLWVLSLSSTDNSYGPTEGGTTGEHDSWPKHHNFNDLLESDKQHLAFSNRSGEKVLDIQMDLIDGGNYSTPSGYGIPDDVTVGHTVGEHLLVSINGSPADVRYRTSTAYNINENGPDYASMTDNSPAWDIDNKDPAYTPVPAFSNWVYNVLWEVRIKRSVFVTASSPDAPGYPAPGLDLDGVEPIELHASPSKAAGDVYGAESVIGDYVWLDVDRDGIQDLGEPGIGDVTLELWRDPNGDGDFSDAGRLRELSTGANGDYLFDELASGLYSVRVTDTRGRLDGLELTVGSIDPHQPILLGTNDVYRLADFGYAPIAGMIGDYVWYDTDADAMQDAGEPGIGGVTVDLLVDLAGNGFYTNVLATTVTDALGKYRFVDLPAGSYVVDVTDVAGELIGLTHIVSVQSATDPTPVITLWPGRVYLRADFGYTGDRDGAIGDLVWEDFNCDGTRDPGEPGLRDVSVDLIYDVNGNGVRDPGDSLLGSMFTDGNGEYLFTGLVTDTGGGSAAYLVFVSDTNNRLRMMRHTVGPIARANNNSQMLPYSVVLTPAAPVDLTADFGYCLNFPRVHVGDRVWYDSNSDGIQDPGEQGIENVLVELWV